MAIFRYFTDPFRFNVLERILGIDAEAEHDSVGVIIRKGTQTVELFLTGGVPEGELDVHIIDKDVMNIVFEDSGLVYCRKVAAIAQSALDKLR